MLHVPGRAIQSGEKERGESLPYSWLVVTHVCRHWRVASLSTSQLWNTIWVTWNTEFVQEMLRRSMSRNLTINIMRPPSYSLYLPQADCLGLVFSSLHRIERICGEIPFRLREKARNIDGSNVKDLVLRRPTLHVLNTEYSASIDGYLGSCHLPNLDRLELYFYSQSWAENLCRPTLKHLTLHGEEKNFVHGIHFEGPTSLSHLVEMLINLPLLETLRLQFALRTPSLSDHMAKVADLPCLTSFEITAHCASTCSLALEHLSFSTDTTLSVECPGVNEHELAGLFLSMKKKMYPTHEHSGESENALKIYTVELRIEDNSLRLRGWKKHYGVMKLVKNEPLAHPQLDMVLWRDWEGIWFDQFEPLVVLEIFRAATIESMVLDGDKPALRLAGGELARRVSEMPKLRELCIGPISGEHDPARIYSCMNEVFHDNWTENTQNVRILHTQNLELYEESETREAIMKAI